MRTIWQIDKPFNSTSVSRGSSPRSTRPSFQNCMQSSISFAQQSFVRATLFSIVTIPLIRSQLVRLKMEIGYGNNRKQRTRLESNGLFDCSTLQFEPCLRRRLRLGRRQTNESCPTVGWFSGANPEWPTNSSRVPRFFSGRGHGLRSSDCGNGQGDSSRYFANKVVRHNTILAAF